MKALRYIVIALALAAVAVVAHATVARATASIAAQNTFSSTVAIAGPFNVSLSGTWSATVHLQRSYDAGVTWMDVASYTANIEDRGLEAETGVLYRIGVKTGNYVSGTVVARVSQ
jgi:hypothetical protein